MALETEFAIEIPDQEADTIVSCGHAIDLSLPTHKPNKEIKLRRSCTCACKHPVAV